MGLAVVVIALACLLVATPAAAVTHVVDDNLVPCQSGAPAVHGTISAAVAAASPGDTILVSAGTYPGNVIVSTVDLTLRA